ncbi:MAG: biopolymer transporter ExbD [Phycisphaerales bacterium]|nr:MAG: biopolymer transporter ExbD [Phycisphaerales bacterium]
MRIASGIKGRHRHAALTFNATPMIDVVFLLTVFFMLVSRFASAENVTMMLPDPAHSEARAVKIPERVVINCRCADELDPAAGVLYSLGPNPPITLAALSDLLESYKAQRGDLKVIVRADRRLTYADVRAVMQIVARHGIAMIHVAARTPGGAATGP